MAKRSVHSARHRANPAPPRISAGDGAPSTGSGSAGEPRARGDRSRGVAIRAVALLGASAVVIALGVAGAGSTGAPVAATVKAFLLDWETGNYSGAAALTTGNPELVRRSLQAAFRELGA